MTAETITTTDALTTTAQPLNEFERATLARLSDAEIPWPQLRRLWQLAHSHGHQWAVAVSDDLPNADQHIAWSQRLIAEESFRAFPYNDEIDQGIAGICYPDAPDADGYISHTTGTGRLTWSVGADGHTHLVISRPTGWCLLANVRPWDAEAGESTILLTPCPVAFKQRHVDALFETLAAIVSPPRAAQAVAPLYAALATGR